MAEVTINIESSLAAMAFVVADQQDTIKALRAINAEEIQTRKEYCDELCKLQQKCEEQSKLMDKIREETKDARIERDRYCNEIANMEEECAVLHQKNDKLNADIKEFYAAREVLQNDYKNLMRECNEEKKKVEKYERDLCRSYLNDFQWEPWSTGKEYIAIPFENLKEKNCFPLAFIMYELLSDSSLNAPTDKKYSPDTPWIEVHHLNINFDKHTATIYTNCNMKPRLYALVYPNNLITKDAMSLFRLQQQGDNVNKDK